MRVDIAVIMLRTKLPIKMTIESLVPQMKHLGANYFLAYQIIELLDIDGSSEAPVSMLTVHLHETFFFLFFFFIWTILASLLDGNSCK